MIKISALALLLPLLLLPAAAGAQSAHLPPGGSLTIPDIAAAWPESFIFETWLQVVGPGAWTLDAGAFRITCDLPACSVELDGSLGGMATLGFDLYDYSVHALSVEVAVDGPGTMVRLRRSGVITASAFLPGELPASIEDLTLLNGDALAVLVDHTRLWDGAIVDVNGLTRWLFRRPPLGESGLVALWGHVEGAVLVDELAGRDGVITAGLVGQPLCRQAPLVVRFHDGFESGDTSAWSEVVLE